MLWVETWKREIDDQLRYVNTAWVFRVGICGSRDTGSEETEYASLSRACSPLRGSSEM